MPINTSGENEILNRKLIITVTEITNETVWIPTMKEGEAITSALKFRQP